MVIGGLIRDNITSSTSKVPLLGDIPILGWLFKNKTTSVEKTNLMIFITPYIVKNESEANELTRRKNDSLEESRREFHMEKKGVAPIVLPPKTSGSGEQSTIVNTPAATGNKPSTELKSNATITGPANASPVPPGENDVLELKTGISSTLQPPTSSGSPKEGVQ